MRPVLRLVSFFAIPLCLGGPPSPAAAQTTDASPTLEGTVLDSSGAPIAGCSRSRHVDHQTASPSTTTNERGEFALTLAPDAIQLPSSRPGSLTARNR